MAWRNPARLLGAECAGHGMLGWIIERTTFRFARHEHLNGLVISLGLVAVLQDIALAIWGADPLSIPPPLPRTLEEVLEQRSYPVGRDLEAAEEAIQDAGIEEIEHA